MFQNNIWNKKTHGSVINLLFFFFKTFLTHYNKRAIFFFYEFQSQIKSFLIITIVSSLNTIFNYLINLLKIFSQYNMTYEMYFYHYFLFFIFFLLISLNICLYFFQISFVFYFYNDERIFMHKKFKLLIFKCLNINNNIIFSKLLN